MLLHNTINPHFKLENVPNTNTKTIIIWQTAADISNI